MKTHHLTVVSGSLILSILWWIWSFTQTDPNLYYSSTLPWVAFQQHIWQIDRPTVVTWYVVMIVAAFGLYLSFLRSVSRWKESRQHNDPSYSRHWTWVLIAGFTGMTIVLLLSNNALSHDIYNYMFNAKAVALYGQDPHQRSAVEIAPQDEWVRFMHNVHTPAPYGHFWTYLTLLPFFAGLGKFISTYVFFKIFMVVGLGILVWIQWKMLDHKNRLFWFLLNPLVLIETLSSGHNDVWMMVFALASFAVLQRSKKMFSWNSLISFGLLILSTQIKEATIMLLPLWVSMALRENRHLIRYHLGKALLRITNVYWSDSAAILLFLPLLTSRSQQFNSWYLMWSITFLPFVRSRVIKSGLIIFSLTSMMRSIPVLFVGGYSEAVQSQMRLITWSAIPILGVYLSLSRLAKRQI